MYVKNITKKPAQIINQNEPLLYIEQKKKETPTPNITAKDIQQQPGDQQTIKRGTHKKP